jgi:hypothetical protein
MSWADGSPLPIDMFRSADQLVALAVSEQQILLVRYSEHAAAIKLRLVRHQAINVRSRKHRGFSCEARSIGPLWMISIPGHEAHSADRFEQFAQLVSVVQ